MFSIGLHNPKTAINVGHVLRAADAYGAAMVATTGNRIRAATNVSGAESKIPVIRGDDLHSMIPFGCIPVAIDLIPGAIDLCRFVHPRNAFYIFGAEDATLGAKVLSWCKYTVYVPTKICMNLSACVNVVLYDRVCKESNARDDRVCKESNPIDDCAAASQSNSLATDIVRRSSQSTCSAADHIPDFGCKFPGKCCMPGDHFESECHTAEDMDNLNQENKS